MTDNQETSADIIAEMRRRIAVKMSDAWYTQEEWRKLCDRLEAAWKRERGDYAKLREFARLVSHMNDDGYWNGSASICALVDKAEAALAAPARNCDRFRNAGEALEALERHCNSSGNGCMRCPLVGHSTEELSCKIGWLFAPATEQKGGDK